VQTRNVRRFQLHSATAEVELDGQKLGPAGNEGETSARSASGWGVAEPAPEQKSPERSGPFKRAFDRKFVLVYAAADPLARQRALFDAERWWYVANGDCTVVSDEQFLFGNFKGRNVILYGNADTNRAWQAVVPDNCPLTVRNGLVAAGAQRFEGDDLSCVFVYPRRGDDIALVGVIGHSGDRGARAGVAISIFGSGVGIPDFVVFGSEVLTSGDAGVRAAGWFDQEWKLRP
jgi:hypothetical protein